MPRYREDEIEIFEDILRRKLGVFEAYHHGEREAKSLRAKRFLEVCQGIERPITNNEKAYLYYLSKIGKPVVHTGQKLPQNLKHKPYEMNTKLDDAQESMARWRPWHD